MSGWWGECGGAAAAAAAAAIQGRGIKLPNRNEHDTSRTRKKDALLLLVPSNGGVAGKGH